MERNYFASCVHGDHFSGGDAPVLVLVGDADQFFGAGPDSVATLAKREGQPTLVGHGLESLRRAKAMAPVAVLHHGRHDLTQTHDSAIRLMIKQFFDNPRAELDATGSETEV